MLAKNNKQEQLRQSAMKDKRFGLKKLSVGLASVALGTILFLGQANAVSAAELGEGVEATTAVQAGEEVQEPTVETEEMNTPVVESSVVETPEVTNTPEQQDPAEVPEEQSQVVEDKVVTETNVAQHANIDSDSEFLKKRDELQDAFKKWDKIRNDIKTEGRDAPNSSEYNQLTELSNKTKGLFAELEQLARTEKDINSYNGLKDTLYNVYTVVPQSNSVLTGIKNGAKRYIERAYVKDLTAEQRTKYGRAIDNISSGADIEQKIENILHIARAEALVGKVASGKVQHIKNAKEALETAKEVIAKGTSVDGVNNLLQDLQGRLDTVIEKYKSPAEKVKDGAKAHLKRAYIGNLENDQLTKYHNAIDKISNHDADYTKKIEDIFQVVGAEVLVKKVEKGQHQHINRAKTAIQTAKQVVANSQIIEGAADLLQGLEHRLTKVVDAQLPHKQLIETELTTNPNNSWSEAQESTAKSLTFDVIVADYKEEAKAHINHAYNDQDLSKDRYKAAIDKISNDDPDYEQKIEDIMKVATAETLVKQAEAGRHVEDAKNALNEAGKETAGGKLIDGKDELISSLQGRLNRFTFKEVTPAEEAKDETKDYINKVFGIDLDESRREAYKKAIDQISDEDEGYDQKIQSIIKVAVAEALVNKVEKGAKQHTNQAIQALEEAKNNTTGSLVDNKDQLLQGLQQRLDAVTGKHMDKKQPPVKNSQEAFTKKRMELSEVMTKWNYIYQEVQTNHVATKEQHTQLTQLSKKFVKLFSELDRLAENEQNKNIVQVVKDTVYKIYSNVPTIKVI